MLNQLRELISSDLRVINHFNNGDGWEVIYRQALMNWAELLEGLASECRGGSQDPGLFAFPEPED